MKQNNETKKQTPKETVLQILGSEIRHSTKTLAEAITELTNNPLYAVEWNQHEKAAMEHSKIKELQTLSDLVSAENWEEIKNVIACLEKKLLGDSHNFPPIFDTNHNGGGYALAIEIRAKVIHYTYHQYKQVIEFMEKSN